MYKYFHLHPNLLNSDAILSGLIIIALCLKRLKQELAKSGKSFWATCNVSVIFPGFFGTKLRWI